VLQVFALVLIPVTIGMLVRWKRPHLADRLDRPIRIISAVFLLLIVIAAIVKERDTVLESFRLVGPPRCASTSPASPSVTCPAAAAPQSTPVDRHRHGDRHS
jgi:hypothetical protein